MHINVLDHEIQLEIVSRDQWGREAYGDFDCHELRIRIVDGLPETTYLTTLFHELTHVKQYIFGKEMSEDEANQDALFWHSVIKNNVLFAGDEDASEE